MPHRTTRKPSTLRIWIDSLRAQLGEDGSLQPETHLPLRHVFGDQILDPLGGLKIEMLIAAGRTQAATVDRIGERLFARLACRGSVVDLGRELGARLGEVPFLIFGAGVWLHGLPGVFGHDARRFLAEVCLAPVATSR